jgi:hypothetical protein
LIIVFLTSPSTDAMDTAMITKKLKAADPTIVEGPSSPGVEPKLETVSMSESRISGALNKLVFLPGSKSHKG